MKCWLALGAWSCAASSSPRPMAALPPADSGIGGFTGYNNTRFVQAFSP